MSMCGTYNATIELLPLRCWLKIVESKREDDYYNRCDKLDFRLEIEWRLLN